MPIGPTRIPLNTADPWIWEYYCALKIRDRMMKCHIPEGRCSRLSDRCSKKLNKNWIYFFFLNQLYGSKCLLRNWSLLNRANDSSPSVEPKTSITFVTATNHCSPRCSSHQPSLHYRISLISICHLHVRFSGCLKQVYLWYCLSLRGVIFCYLCRDCLVSGLTPFRGTCTKYTFETYCTHIPCSSCTVICHISFDGTGKMVLCRRGALQE